MKKFSIILFLVSMSLFCRSQDLYNKMNMGLIKSIQIPNDPERWINMLVQGDLQELKRSVLANGGIYKYDAGDVASIKIKVKYVLGLAASKSIRRLETNEHKYSPMNDKMILPSHTNALSVQDGTCFGGTGYNGEGVVVGIIDTGLDIAHPDFKNTDGTTRIKYIWDQRPNFSGGTQPIYGYGLEWNASAINNGFCTSQDTGIDHNSHGTIAAGVTAGNGNCIGNYHGVAPKADLIAVALDFNNFNGSNADIIADAVNYVFNRASALGEPCVINCSFGDYFGSHDGQDLETVLINSMVTQQTGRAFVCPVGNAGGYPLHLGYDVSSVDTNFTWFNTTGGLISNDVWADTNNFKHVSFSIGADLVDNVNHNYFFAGRTKFRTIDSIPLHTNVRDTIFNANGNRIAIVNFYATIQYGNTYDLWFDVVPDSTTYQFRFMTTGSGHFDCWNYYMTSANLPNQSQYAPMANYIAPDATQTMATGFQCSDKTITVGGYTNRNTYTVSCIDTLTHTYTILSDTGYHVGQIWNQSSVGPTRDRRVKPEVTAPSQLVISPGVLSEMPYMSSHQCWKVAAGGCDLVANGTSFSSPAVAGIVALYLQLNPTTTWDQIRNCIIYNARQDSLTGSNLPNNTWGYGKADACLALHCSNTAVSKVNQVASNLNNYPNPFNETTTISYRLPSDKDLKDAVISISDVLGNELKSLPIKETEGTLSFNKSSLKSGIYFYSIKIGTRTVATRKMVVL
ncbi:MAG: S8/S53 family peptidase [Bacteroidota bacterium]